MDYKSYKVLKIINKYSEGTDIDVIRQKTNVPKDDFIEIVEFLLNNNYIKFPNNGYVESTNKGKTYTLNNVKNWFINNSISIIAIIISIIALFK